ncbi:RPAB2 [Hepatospora eriocheir]|uniref:RPAB2 n=1 Tax=Hepatospora eriocheir TaxID=1081669 RepID=A0A1X0QJ37_9MICR|nr:RPAB2 [Hepatospora eriocheir]ORD99788.1 RPAB2 [Hepatospora eriocheir]
MGENTVKKTSNQITIYEYAQVLGYRAVQLSNNSKPLVDTEGMTDCLEIAKKEYKEGKIPYIVRRILPDKSYEDWNLSELHTPNNL